MCNIVFRRQIHGCCRKTYDLNTKGEEPRGDVEMFENAIWALKNQTSRTWHIADRWMIQTVAGYVYGTRIHACWEEIIFLSVLPGFIKGTPVFVGKVWLPLDNLLKLCVKWASDQKVNVRMHEEWNAECYVEFRITMTGTKICPYLKGLVTPS